MWIMHFRLTVSPPTRILISPERREVVPAVLMLMYPLKFVAHG